MNFQYSLIQFIENPWRDEGRNIGVIAHDGSRAYLKAIGVREDGATDVGYFGALSDVAQKDSWVYREWINWFEALINEEGKDFNRLNKAFDQLVPEASKLIVRPGGLLEAPEGSSHKEVLEYLFENLVSAPLKPRINVFGTRVEEIFEKTGLSYRKDFERDVEVEFLATKQSLSFMVKFPFILMNEPRTAFKVVRYRTSRGSFIRQINDAVFTFERTIANGFLERDRCVILTERPTKDKIGCADSLGRIASVINVTRSTAEKYINEIFTKGGKVKAL